MNILSIRGIAAVFNAGVIDRGKSPGDTPGEAVEFHPDKAHPFRSQGDEGANAATRLQDRGVMGHAKMPERVIHGPAQASATLRLYRGR
jgi:hypothetical protein